MASKLASVLDAMIEYSEDHMLSLLGSICAVLLIYGVVCMLRHGLPAAVARLEADLTGEGVETPSGA